MLELLSYEFFQRALVGGLFIGLTCGLVSVFLVLKRYSLLGDSFAHASFGGVALGFVLNWNPLLTALGFVGLASLGLDKLVSRLKLYGEAAIALVLSFGMAFALILISVANKMDSTIFSYLFGSILTINSTDIVLAAIVLVLVLIFYKFAYKNLLYSSLNQEVALVRDKRTVLINRLFIVLCALTVVISIRAVGILLISALIVVPGLIGLRLGSSLKSSLVISSVVSVLGILLGIILSYYLDIPTGATIVMTLLGLFVLSLFVKRN